MVSRAASLPEVVGDAGILFDPHSGEGLESGLRMVLAQPEHALALRTRGLERARGYTWEKSAAEHLAIYRKVLRESDEQ